MKRYLVRQAGTVLASLLVLVIATFAIVQLIPGDPARAVAGVDASQEQVEQVRENLGMNKPLFVQFMTYLHGLITGNLGRSFRTNEAVTDIIATRLPYTAGVALLAIILTFIAATLFGATVAIGTYANKRKWLDSSFNWFTGLVASVPEYVSAAVLVAIFAITLHLFPAAGAESVSSWVLPTIALSLAPTCTVSRVVRREMSRILTEDYMRTARGWRIGTIKLYAKYALPNAMVSTLTLSGLVLTGMLGGAIIMENVFAWPGMGRAVVEAILTKDFPVIRGIVMVLGIIAILLNTIIDISLRLIDRRILQENRG
ncbi:MAG: ABC transporter permease [Bifidobacterium tibiigranuli]|jgi:peptide/nickel transport system permease protein|nr:ABC transporter permease [Bifidobacterium tibiigranuli]